MQKILRKDELLHYIMQSDVCEEFHQHTEIELLLVMEGKVKLEFQQESFVLQHEDIVIVNSNQKHRVVAEHALFCCFHISYEQLSLLTQKNRLTLWCNSTCDQPMVYQELRHILMKLLQHDQESELLLAKALQYELLHHLVHNFLVKNMEITLPDKQQKYFERMEEIRNYINCNYHQEITLQDLSDHLNFSMPYMSKFFKKQFGMNFVEYISSIRLNHAVDDLIYTDFPITRIVLENGFANVSVFNKLFKEVYRTTPSVYRKDFKYKSNKEKENQKNHINDKMIRDKLGQYFQQNHDSCSQVRAVLDVSHTSKLDVNTHKLMNVGYAYDLLRGDIQQHILQLKETFHFTYARFFGILANDMELHQEDGARQFNFSYVDKVLDFLVHHDIIPFIEVGVKAKMLHEAVGKDVVYHSEYSPSLQEIKKVLHALLVHCMNRYGKKAVANWYFELWDHTNITAPYKQSHSYAFAGDLTYLALFEEIAGTIREVTPQSPIGGGGFSTNFAGVDYGKLLEEWSRQKQRPDFISFHLYPYHFDPDQQGVVYDKRADFILQSLTKIQTIIQASPLHQLPLIISEWNINISNRNMINDTCFKGAYLVKNSLDALGNCEMMGYWFISDLLSEYKDAYGMLFGGSGLLSRDGLFKPSAHAISVLRKIGNEVISKQEYFIASKKAENEYVLVAHNYKHFNNYYFQNCENVLQLQERNQIFEDDHSRSFEFQLTNVKNGKYRIKMYLISSKHGSVLDEWIKMGELSELKNDEFEYLERVSFPKLKLSQTEVKQRKLDISFTLLPNEFAMVYVYYDFE